MHTAMRNQMPDSIMARSKSDPTKARWSSLESLIALLIDEVRQNTWVYIQAHSDKKIPRPEPIARPGINRERARKAISLEVAQMMDPRLRGLSEDEAQDKLDEFTRYRKRLRPETGGDD